MPGRVVVQWDKEDCAHMGIIGVDLPGPGMMAVIEDTLELIPETYREEVDLAQLPPDDPAVFESRQTADAIGMFQVESRAQMSSLPRMMPKRFYDIVVQLAIVRWIVSCALCGFSGIARRQQLHQDKEHL